MKVYTRIVIDMASLSVIEADHFDYHGPVAEAKGKGATTPETPETNKRPTYEEESDPTSAQVRDSQARKLRNRRGMSGTVLTSPLGSSGGEGGKGASYSGSSRLGGI